MSTHSSYTGSGNPNTASTTSSTTSSITGSMPMTTGTSSMNTSSTMGSTSHPSSSMSTFTSTTGPTLVDSTTTTRTTAGTAATTLPATGRMDTVNSTQTTTVPAPALQRVDDATVMKSGEQVVEEVAAYQVAAINKYVTTEHQSTAVPVMRERAVVEREPIVSGQRVAASTLGSGHVEVPLMAERAVATKETVPVEKVRLGLGVERIVERVDMDTAKEGGDYGTVEGQTKTLGNAPSVPVNTNQPPATVNVNTTHRM